MLSGVRKRKVYIDMAMRSGLFIPSYHAISENPAIALQRDIELVQLCDRLGYEEAWYGEHHSGGVELIASPEIMIAAAAERTKNIRLGTGVISVPYHHPLNVASRIVQLDHMTKGRAMFGFGSGSLVHDAKMRGIDPNETRDRLEQAVDVIIRLLEGEEITLRTNWFELCKASIHLGCYSDPLPELAVAVANTPSGGRLAGRHGIGMVCMTASVTSGYDALDSNWQIARETAAENGHSLSASGVRLVAPIHIAETRDQAHANVRYGVERFLDYSFSLTPARRAKAQGLDPIQVITEQRGGIIGTPDDVVALIQRFEQKIPGFGCFLQLEHDWTSWENTKRSYELYAQFVVPKLRTWDQRRQRSLQMFKDHEAEIDKAKQESAARMFEKHKTDVLARQNEGRVG